MKKISSIGVGVAGVLAGVLAVPSLAYAQQAGPHRHDAARHPRADLDEQITIEGGKKVSLRTVLSHIDPKHQVELHNGQRVTVAELFGHLRDLEDRHGQPLHTIPAEAHVHPASAQALAAQQRVHADHVAQLRRAEQSRWADTIRRRAVPRPMQFGGPQGGSGAARAPWLQPLTTGWQKELGSESTLAAYGAFSVAVDAPNERSATCLASVDFGGWVLKHHQSLARVAFHEEAVPGSATGSVGVYILGNATAVYKRDFKVGKETGPRYAHTWATPELNHEFGPFWGIVTFQVKAKASAGFELDASNEMDPTKDSVGCTADFRPSGNAKAIVDVGAKIGIPKLSHLLRVGVKGDVTIAKVATPAAAGMRVEKQVSMNEKMKASVNANFLSGQIFFEVDLANPCISIPFLGKHCLLSLFHVKSHYEFPFHKWGGFAYDHVLLDADRTQPLASPSASASSAASAPPPAPGAVPGCSHDPAKPFGIRSCDDYVAQANRCADRPDGAQLRAQSNAERARFESLMCQEGGAAKLPDICEESLRFLKRSCP